jgi:hypothetical protein
MIRPKFAVAAVFTHAAAFMPISRHCRFPFLSQRHWIMGNRVFPSIQCHVTEFAIGGCFTRRAVSRIDLHWPPVTLHWYDAASA